MDKQFVQETVQKNKRRGVYARLNISKLPYIFQSVSYMAALRIATTSFRSSGRIAVFRLPNQWAKI